MPSINLPNLIPTPTENNLTSEAQKYYSLYVALSRTKTGQIQFTSSSSGKTYRTTDYQSDVDVYNKGEEGMLNLLFKYVLSPYIITAELINSLILQAAAAPVEAEVTWNQDMMVYNVNLSYEPVSSIYGIRFRAPNDFVSRGTFLIDKEKYTPKLSNSSGDMPAKTFIQNRVITANVDKTLKIITFESGGGFILSDEEPSPGGGLWIDTTKNLPYYYNSEKSQWTPISGVYFE